ncbi:MAG TPA: prepilin-type N-terminal cleavage/methylation domain-containing protein [Patescibacteria group bacterium]|nr:prepilin-type N-terminal cleavage/methylation domain-containing protein [Patescibacteria group bacterium]
MTSKGFTILEMILAVFILTIAVFSSYSLIQQTLISTSLNQSKLVAYYFAQQELENIKNVRDTNWLQGSAWNQNISSISWTPLNFSDGSQSIFQKSITVSEISSDCLEIEVVIKWSERGREQSVEIINQLYNWYE